MAEAQDAQHNENDGPPYPTFMERWIGNNEAPLFKGAFQRLIWPIRGEFPSAISVMPEPHQNTGTPQPLFNPETGEWHEVASQSITDTKVSYIEASLMNLDYWGRDWERLHMEHADPAYDECEFVTYGDLENDVRPFAEQPERGDGTWSWDERSDTEILVHCCGEDRPLGKEDLTLGVRPSPGNGFVTVKDYVGAVHPWLMSMQDDILAAMRIAEVLDEEPEYPPSSEWMLSNSDYDAPRHYVIHPEKWEFRNEPPSQITG
ncbi:hypothetical protein KCU93_g3667, partial [Aureobasidium melanogenum]